MCLCHHRSPVARDSSRAFASLSTFNFGLLTSFSPTLSHTSEKSPASSKYCHTSKTPSRNSFTIRTSKTPLPQLLYNPHLRAPLGSAGNKGLITPLESALAESGGWAYGASRSAFWTPVKSHGLPPQARARGEEASCVDCLSRFRPCELRALGGPRLFQAGRDVNSVSFFEPSTFDRRSRPCRDFQPFTKLSFQHSRTSLQMPVYRRRGGIQPCTTATEVSSTSSRKRCGVSKSRFSLPPHCFSFHLAPGRKPPMPRQLPLSQPYPRSRTAGCTCASSVPTLAVRRCASTSPSNWRKKFSLRSITTVSITARSRSTAPTSTTWTSMPSWTPSAPPRTANTSPCRAATPTCASPRRAIT